MSKNDQTVTARVKDKWYCWSVTAESCDDEDELVLSISDPFCACANTKRQAIRQIEEWIDVSEYGNYDAEDGRTYLAKDGKPVRILELTEPTNSKMEQVDVECRVKELEEKLNRMSEVLISLVSSRQTLQKALEQLSKTANEMSIQCKQYAKIVEFERMSYSVDKKKALEDFFELDKNKNVL